jgi:peptide/nickel transport system permease protein
MMPVGGEQAPGQAVASPLSDADMAGPAAGQASFRRSALWRVLRRPAAFLPVIFLAGIIVACFAAPLTAPYGPLTQNLIQIDQGPSWHHLLGTDTLGRDVLSRLLYGGQASFIGVAEAMAVTVLLAVPSGLASGYLQGRTDTAISRVIDVLLAIPAIVVLLMALSVFGDGGSLAPAMIALGVLNAPSLARVVRSATIQVSSELYVAAARVVGLKPNQVMWRHILPRVAGPTVVNASFLCGGAVLVQTGLAFLGFTVQPPNPSWGSMAQEAGTVLYEDAWLIWPSGLIIALTVLSFILIGDAIRDSAQLSWSGQIPASRRAALRRAARAAARVTEAPSESAQPRGGKATSASPMLLDVIDLSVVIPTADGVKTVVEEITFSIAAGEAVALVGESGCGKTVTALSILGLPPGGGHISGGSVRFRGRRVDNLRAADWRKIRGSGISYIAQEPIVSLDPSFTAGNQLTEVIRLHNPKSPRKAVAATALDLLARCGIAQPDEVFGLYPHQISAGTAQRVAMARALAGNPALLIADEPTTALDVTIQAEILDLLHDLRAESGMSVLFVTHDWGVVADMCSKAVVMYAGQVVEVAPVTDVVAAARHPYTDALLRANPHLAVPGDRLQEIPGSVPPPGRWPAGCRFARRCGLATDKCTARPVPMEQLTEVRASRCIRTNELAALQHRKDGRGNEPATTA